MNGFLQLIHLSHKIWRSGLDLLLTVNKPLELSRGFYLQPLYLFGVSGRRTQES